MRGEEEDRARSAPNPTPHASPLTPHCFLGLDFGTSGARAAVIDDAETPIAEGRIDWGQEAEDRLAGSWRETLFELIAGLPAQVRARLRAVAIDGTSATSLILDRELRPLAPPLLYNDARAQREAAELAALAGGATLATAPTSSLPKLLWLHRQVNRPEYFLHQADWLAALLSGRAGISDYHNALKLGVDLQTLAFPDWIRRLAIAPLLPQIVSPGQDIGPITWQVAKRLGLPESVEVRAGTTDSIAAFFATGVDQPGHAVTSLGSTLVLKLISETRVDAPEFGVYSHRLGDRWLAGGASNSGGAALRQYFDDAQLATISERIDPESTSGLDYYPLPKCGERFPVADPSLASRVGPRPADDARFLHGLLEGIARIEAVGYRRLAELGAPPLTRLVTAGGGARNAAWRRIRERVLGVPVAVAEHGEAAYGAARLARGGEALLCSPRR